MSFLGYLLLALAKVLSLAINLYTMVIIVAALISWVNPDPYNPIVRVLNTLTYPVFNLIRRFLPRQLRMLRFDISPIIALLLLTLFETVVVDLLLDAARGFLPARP